MIQYERSDLAAPRKSEYYVAQTCTPDSLATVLRATLHVRGTVKKRRILYKAGQTRIHMDEVEGLGCFIELEVVLWRSQDEVEGMRIAREFMDRLEIAGEDLLAQAYVDLLLSATESKIRDSRFEIESIESRISTRRCVYGIELERDLKEKKPATFSRKICGKLLSRYERIDT